jgi:hypothetical protein
MISILSCAEDFLYWRAGANVLNRGFAGVCTHARGADLKIPCAAAIDTDCLWIGL